MRGTDTTSPHVCRISKRHYFTPQLSTTGYSEATHLENRITHSPNSAEQQALLDHCTLPAQGRRVSAVFIAANYPLQDTAMTATLTLTDVNLMGAFKYYLDNDDLEGLVSDLQIYLGEYLDDEQLEEIANNWVTDIESIEE